MAHILVTGGTGHLGRDVVGRLVEDRHQVRVFSRSAVLQPGVESAIGDLATGEGLEKALEGVDTVIHTATFSPIAQRGGFRLVDFVKSPSSVDVEGTERLIEVCRKTAVQHFVHVSIVGLEGAFLPYARIKLAGERLVQHSTLSWSMVRSAPFFYLLARMLEGIAWLPAWPLPSATFNPVDTSDVADYLVTCAFDGSRGVRREIGGPDCLSLVEFARQYIEVSGLHRSIVPLPLPESLGHKIGFVAAKGLCGTVSWRDWLRDHSRGQS